VDGVTTTARAYVFTDACTACGACLLTCPEHAIVPSVPLQVRMDRCSACGECVEVCPADAVLEVVGDRQHHGAADLPAGAA
jgi:Pyruvate/2-oxoacid:ferredoxin oxidoreductase delta subunit